MGLPIYMRNYAMYKMKLHIKEAKSKYPPCSTKAKKNSYRSKTITKICDDGLELTFEILPNRTTAIEFIYTKSLTFTK